VRELLPGWLLSRAYAFRRAFLPRHGTFRLIRNRDDSFHLSSDARKLPHGRVLFRPRGWPTWEALQLEGLVKVSGSAVRWSRWLDPLAVPGPLEIELPYGLRELSARVLPDAVEVRDLTVELDEVGILGAARTTLTEGSSELGSYSRWLRMFETPSTVAFERLRALALGSGLRVTVVAGQGADRTELEAQLPGRVEVVESLDLARSEIIVPLGPSVRLVPHALATVVCLFHRAPEVAFIHADHDRLERGSRTRPELEPVLGPELLRSRSSLATVVAFRRGEVPALAAPDLEGSGLYGWALDCSVALRQERTRRLPVVLASRDSAVVPDDEAERRVLVRHLRSSGTAAEVLPGLAAGLHHVRYHLPDPPPRVTLVVPTRNAHALVETCVRSVRRLTRYPRYDIHLVDNGSDSAEALAAFEGLARAGDVVLHRDPRPFNFSALNNTAVRRTDAELVCLLNNDIEALHPEWLEEMVSVALQPGVGAVGAKLFYPDGRIQHGGVLVGLHGAADHAYAGSPGDAPGYAQQLLVRREISAVTAACLVVRRALYLEVGGLDEEAFPVSFNDVDFCLKLRDRRYRNVWTPHARLVHHESASRGRARSPEEKARADRELAALRERWAGALQDDPYHSPNLSLSSKVPCLAWPPRERRPWSL
jgi:GT2 family glycosyltransferase